MFGDVQMHEDASEPRLIMQFRLSSSTPLFELAESSERKLAKELPEGRGRAAQPRRGCCCSSGVNKYVACFVLRKKKEAENEIVENCGNESLAEGDLF